MANASGCDDAGGRSFEPLGDVCQCRIGRRFSWGALSKSPHQHAKNYADLRAIR